MQTRTQDLGPKLTVILVLCSLFYLVGIDWGLPTRRAESWAHDELTPYHRGGTAMDRFHGRYPPLHYRVVNAGYWLVDQFSSTDLEPPQLNRRRQLAARLISISMALITLVLIVATYRQLFPSATGALLAAAIYGLSPVVVYYSKLANLEAPYLMWFTASLFFFVRVLRQHRLRDYLPFALTATLAGVTKDQAIALYIVPALVILASLVRFKGASPRSWATELFDRRVLLAIVVSGTTFAAIHELWVPTGFREHLAVILGPDTERFTLYARTLSGSFELLRDAALNLLFVTGVLAFGAALATAWWAIRQRQTVCLSLLLFPLSLMIFFIFPVGYHYDRFFLPAAVVVALLAGRGIVLIHSRMHVAAIALAALLLTGLMIRSAVVDLRMVRDHRYQAERWIAENSNTAVLGISDRYLPRNGARASWTRLSENKVAWIGKQGFDHLVVVPQEAARGLDAVTLSQLRNTELNFRPKADFRAPRVQSLVWPGVRSNLAAIDPEIWLLESIRPWRISEAEILHAMEQLNSAEQWASLAKDVLETVELPGRQSLSRNIAAVNMHWGHWTVDDQFSLLAYRCETGQQIRLTRPSRAPQTRIEIETINGLRSAPLDPRVGMRIKLSTEECERHSAIKIRATSGWQPKNDGRKLGVRVALVPKG